VKSGFSQMFGKSAENLDFNIDQKRLNEIENQTWIEN